MTFVLIDYVANADRSVTLHFHWTNPTAGRETEVYLTVSQADWAANSANQAAFKTYITQRLKDAMQPSTTYAVIGQVVGSSITI